MIIWKQILSLAMSRYRSKNLRLCLLSKTWCHRLNFLSACAICSCLEIITSLISLSYLARAYSRRAAKTAPARLRWWSSNMLAYSCLLCTWCHACLSKLRNALFPRTYTYYSSAICCFWCFYLLIRVYSRSFEKQTWIPSRFWCYSMEANWWLR